MAALAVLLAVLVSATAEAMVAVLVMGPLAGAVPVMRMSGAEPTKREVTVHVTVTPLRPHVQPEPLTPPNTKLAGSVSVTSTLLVAFGPLLITLRV